MFVNLLFPFSYKVGAIKSKSPHANERWTKCWTPASVTASAQISNTQPSRGDSTQGNPKSEVQIGRYSARSEGANNYTTCTSSKGVYTWASSSEGAHIWASSSEGASKQQPNVTGKGSYSTDYTSSRNSNKFDGTPQ